MSTCHIAPSALSGSIRLPSSKSHTMRALVLALLGRGESRLHHLLDSPDTRAMIAACRQLGATVEVEGRLCRVKGVGGHPHTPDDVIDAGNSGLVLRFIGAVAALGSGTTVITGDASIRERRPAQPLLDGISQLQGWAASTRGNGHAPLIIKGPIAPGRLLIDGSDSQPVSALLIAASQLDGVTELFVEPEGELPFVEMTLRWLWSLGIDAERVRPGHYRIEGPARYDGFEIEIPGDYSAAAFPAAGAVVTGGRVELTGLSSGDGQGDATLLEWLVQMGARVEGERISAPEGGLRGISVDINRCIDALPIMAVLGCFAKGETVLYNGAVARTKESDRIGAIATELRKMGAQVEESEDGLRVVGTRLHGASLQSWHDHRIAMALAVAAFGAKGESSIDGFECAAKSFPNFIESMQGLGAVIA